MASHLALHSPYTTSSPPKSGIRRLYESMQTHHGATMSRAKAHAVETAHSFRQGGESLVVGAILGGIQAENFARGGLDVRKVPVDAVVGVAGVAAAVYMAQDSVAPDLRNAGCAALAVFAFRKTAELVAKQKARKGVAAAGEYSDMGEDPIIRAARGL